jgi:CRP-like cAMP-binding protein
MFGGLGEAELNLVRPLLDEIDYAAGSRILVQGEPNNTVFFILSGEVAIRKHPGEREGKERESQSTCGRLLRCEWS